MSIAILIAVEFIEPSRQKDTVLLLLDDTDVKGVGFG